MKYSGIQELPSCDGALQELSSPELAALGNLWLEKKGELENSGEYGKFIKEMQREWAIETGIIERLYSLDRGVTETLIKQGIDAALIHQSIANRDKAENVANMINDQQHVVEGLFEFVTGEQKLSEHYIKSMHQQLTAHQDYTEAITLERKFTKIPLLKGKYKEQPNNPTRPDGVTHEYCPPILVADDMERLVRLYLGYESTIAPEVLSAWLHHCFTQIHPFQDGNGRIARALASLVFLKAGFFPLVIRNSDREKYIAALEEADNGKLAPLVEFFTKRQRDSILTALGIRQQVGQTRYWRQQIDNTVAALNKRAKAERAQIEKIYAIAARLQDRTKLKFDEIQQELDVKLRQVEVMNREQYKARVSQAKDGENYDYYFRKDIVEMANKHRYYANSDHYKSWTRLTIHVPTIFEIIFSIHGYGHADNGVMVVSGFTFEKVPSEEEGHHQKMNIRPSNTEIFQFNYLENEESIIKRFNKWLDESITFALAEWQKTIT